MESYIKNFNIPKIKDKIVSSREFWESVSNKNSNCFTLLHNNIRSVSKNIDELKVFIDGCLGGLDCLILTETFKICDKNLFNLQGYTSIYNSGDLNKNDGILVYVKNGIDLEYEFVKIGPVNAILFRLGFHSVRINILAVYRSPSLCPSEFITDLEKFLQKNRPNSKVSLIVGDLNIDLIIDSTNREEYLNVLSEYGYLSTINSPTREKACYDHIMLKGSIQLDTVCSMVVDHLITDHKPVVVQIDFLENCKKSIKNDQSREFVNFRKLRQLLKNETWSSVIDKDDSHHSMDAFFEIFSRFIEQSKYLVNINRNERKRTPWITKGLVRSINYKNEIYKKCKNNPSNILLTNELKRYNCTLKQLIAKRKVEYYRNEINSKAKNPDQLWKVLRNFDRKTPLMQPTSVANNVGKKITDKKELPDVFNEFFIGIGEKLAKEIKNTSVKFKLKRNVNSIVLMETDEDEVIKIIHSLKNSKSAGIDKITTDILKNTAEFIATPITFVINRAIEMGQYPDVLKKSIVVPLYKSGDRSLCSNYRPISISPVISKIFEKVLKVRITKFLDKYGLISDQQYGFRAGRSTQNAIAYLTGKIYKAIDDKIPTICVFIDLAKAFDTVSHHELLLSLERIGFRGESLKLMESYLSHRLQAVKIGDEVGTFREVKYGVPQGTVLGPLLFVIYINDLFDLPSVGDILSFADDTAIIYQDTSWGNLKKKIEVDFAQIIEFLNYKVLTINVEKTKFVAFTS